MKKLILFSVAACFAVILCSTTSFSAETDAEEILDLRVKKCVSCCNNEKLVCFNLNPDRRLCEAEFQNCFATCRSRGAVPSEWDKCWSQSNP